MSITQILDLDKMSSMIVFGLMGFMVLLMVLPFAAAQPILITVERSDVCKLSITCLPLKELIPLDTSNEKVSGKLTEDGRSKPLYKNHHMTYQFSKEKYIVCVECDGMFQDHSRKITIETLAKFTYIKQSDSKIVNNTFYDYSDRHIENCRTATISSNLELLKDTIFVMGNDCKVPSKFTEQTKTVKPYTKLNYCGNECQHQKFMKAAKEKSKSTYLINPAIKLKNQNGTIKVNG